MDKDMKNVAGWMSLLMVGVLATGWGCQEREKTRGANLPGESEIVEAEVAASAPSAAKPEAAAHGDGGQWSREKRLALAARAEKLLAMEPTTDPGREFVNRLRTAPNPALLALMKSDKPIPSADLWRFGTIENAVEMGEKGPTWPLPGTVKVPRVPIGARVVMDGDLSEPAWEKAFTWKKSYKLNELEESKRTQTEWKLLWDADYLYLGFGCVDEDVRSKPRERDTKVYDDDSVELFISPDERFRGYWEIIVNADNSVFDALESKKWMEWGLDMNTDATAEGLVTHVKREGPDGKPGYCVEMALPWSALLAQKGQKPRIGDVFGFMLVRICKEGKNGVGEDGPFAPVPLMGWGHNIWNRAKMELGE